MTEQLAGQQCRPRDGEPAFDAAQIRIHLARLEGWQFVDGAIEKRYDFADFLRTMAFVNALAWIADAQDHHPDLSLRYGCCTVRFNTHSVGGLSLNDFICAAKVDALVA